MLRSSQTVLLREVTRNTYRNPWKRHVRLFATFFEVWLTVYYVPNRLKSSTSHRPFVDIKPSGFLVQPEKNDIATDIKDGIHCSGKKRQGTGSYSSVHWLVSEPGAITTKKNCARCRTHNTTFAIKLEYTAILT